jgi:hypothetical protein
VQQIKPPVLLRKDNTTLKQWRSIDDQYERCLYGGCMFFKAMSQLVVETVLFFQEMPGNKALA